MFAASQTHHPIGVTVPAATAAATAVVATQHAGTAELEAGRDAAAAKKVWHRVKVSDAAAVASVTRKVSAKLLQLAVDVREEVVGTVAEHFEAVCGQAVWRHPVRGHTRGARGVQVTSPSAAAAAAGGLPTATATRSRLVEEFVFFGELRVEHHVDGGKQLLLTDLFSLVDYL